MHYDLAVIGGGAAGLAAAVTASRNGERVAVLEAGNAIGKKILASGNGRCNLMNTGEFRYYGDSGFVRKVLERCGVKEQKRFWRSIGLITTEESENRVYPCTFQAASVVQVLKTALKIYKADIFLNTPVNECERIPDHGFRIEAGGKDITARRILVATGGPAGQKKQTGSAGYTLLRRFGHSISPLRPALVPLETDSRSISGLSGIRVRCGITLFDNRHTDVHHEKGEMLFTDSGISGICVMQCARFVDGKGYYIEADFADGIFPDGVILQRELIRRKNEYQSMPPETLLIGMMNIRLAYAVMKQAGVPMQGEILRDLGEQSVSDIARAIRHYRIDILRTRGMEDAQVTAGGAECSEFRPDNMESRIVPGLHAAGEILNADGDC